MFTCFVSPSRYLQGPGALSESGTYGARLGERAFVLGGKTALSETLAAIRKSLSESNVDLAAVEVFTGDCTRNNIHRYAHKAGDAGADLIFGVGGGKAADTAKGVAFTCEKPVVIIPATAATNAAASSYAVLYDDSGAVEGIWMFSANPDLVLVDTAVIARSPARAFAAGMGDALSAFYEARTCRENGRALTRAGYRPTEAAFAAAARTRELIFEYGLEAKKAVENRTVTLALEKVAEAVFLSSALGYESGGLSAAHATAAGLTVLRHCRKEHSPVMHGEEVALGIIVLLVIEGRPDWEIREVLAFCQSAGLPTTLAGLGLGGIGVEELGQAAAHAARQPVAKNLALEEVTAELFFKGLMEADRIASAFAGSGN